MGCYDIFYVIICIILMLAFYGAIPLGIIIDPNLFAIMSVWVLYVILSMLTGSCRYIRNVVGLPDVFKNIEAAILSPPKMSMSIQNYHYETKSRTIRGPQGSKTKQEYEVRVNTHKASQDFTAGLWVDQSPHPSTLNYLDVMLITKLRTFKKIIFSPATRMRYKAEKSQFLKEHHTDVYYDFIYHENIPH